MIEDSSVRFATNKEILPEDAEEVVMRSIERLLERDSPQLETIKMQVYFDEASNAERKIVSKTLQTRERVLSAHALSILEVGEESVSDFEALAKLYRRVFRYLLDFPPCAKSGLKAVEKEVAAALESVFPRVGLKAFVQLSEDDRRAQLGELGRIVLGIRLLNRSQGRGSGGLEDLDGETRSLIASLESRLEKEVSALLEECSRYHAAIIRTRLSAGRREDGATATERWAKELANKRQLCGLLGSLLEDVRASKAKAEELFETLRLEGEAVRALVSGRASVPKEEVYPRFSAMGDAWVRLFPVLLGLRGFGVVVEGLSKYRTSFRSTLPENYEPLTAALDSSEEEAAVVELAQTAFPQPATSDNQREGARSEDAGTLVEGRGDEANAHSEAKLLSIHTAEDFLGLPLELQGYCPWTLVHARGLLVPGRPLLGVIQYRGQYFVCNHEAAIEAFMADPERYLDALRELVIKSPEYIHLLRVQRWFPQANLNRLLAQEVDVQMVAGKATKDASTETPLHFNEGEINIDYHWNEWELRRRSLHLLNLQQCTTTSQQTDESHFRRHNETMLYIQRHNWTQTKREKATNPPKKTSFVAGLRGKIGEGAVSKHMDVSGLTPSEAAKPRVVTLTLDL